MKDKELVRLLRVQEGVPNGWNPLESDNYATRLIDKYAINVTWDSTHTGRVWVAWRVKDDKKRDPSRNRAICLAALHEN